MRIITSLLFTLLIITGSACSSSKVAYIRKNVASKDKNTARVELKSEKEVNRLTLQHVKNPNFR